MQYFAILTITLNIAIISGQFDSLPLNNGATPDPGTMKLFNETYYLISTTLKNSDTAEKFAIYTSSDFVNWNASGHVFNATNLPPTWANRNKEFWVPEIHKFGDKYNVYFAAREVGSNRMAIGVAIATHPLGPYRFTDRPIYLDPNSDVIDSTIINNKGTSYFVWKTRNNIKARALNKEGTGFSSDQVLNLYTNNQPWKNVTLEGGPWYIRRGEYHYLLFSGQNGCSEDYKLGAARSLNPLGPYEKRPDPTLSANGGPNSPDFVINVKDLDEKFDQLMFHAFKKDKVCGPWPRITLLASLGLEGLQN